ncbi:DUF4347 domain-containing protein [Oculatella sp. FACHB-28]|uniref:DUF4347 domain-containing protein n=1 Tax=Cyanophyceae TaxID=3028117 RepID=UPI001686AD81|nr:MULTISPECIES: DUF4347 domain-containing protein [Cyanophyceae]MBD1997646.1 DUF4347 domain-containing protein [Leptolyngbya sp. FACHB-541]MBD2055724.1 DUF4347 domain-containing protein [Oculatella sp. FACHB-28]
MDHKNAGKSSHKSQRDRLSDKPNALVVIDPTAQDQQALASKTLPQAEILLLDPQRDGVQQITEALQQHQDLTQVHIFSHGSCENLSLGSARLCLDTLEYYAWDLQAWFPAHAFAAPSVQLHGFGAARGNAVEFLERLHQLTGASIDTSDLASCV